MATFIIRTKSLFWICLLLPVVACSTANDAKQANCDALVTETESACIDMLRRGLDVRCGTYLMAVDMAMKQASGNLFDAGDSNQSAADSFCAIYVDKLRLDRKKHDASMHAEGQQGPQCTALADQFEEQCVPNLGKEKLPSKCRSITTSFTTLNAKKLPQEQRETLCKIYSTQLSKE